MSAVNDARLRLSGMSKDQLMGYTQELEEKINRLNAIIEERERHCGLNNGNTLESISNAEISELIRNRLPKCTYSGIYTTNVEYKFGNAEKPSLARKIELIRENWSLLRDAPKALLSSIFIKNSIYIRDINYNYVGDYLLQTSKMNTVEKVKEARRDIIAAYRQYKSITLYVPENCNCDAQIEIQSKSEVILASIDCGINIRSFVEKIFGNKLTIETHYGE